MLCILCLPFFSFLCCTLLGGSKLISESGLRYLISVVMISCWLITINFFLALINSELVFSLSIGTWFSISNLDLIWGMSINKITLTMLLLIITISTLVHIFSLNYMAGEPHLSRFVGYLGLFTFFMLILVTSPNLVQLFIGWEGVGVCSYLLINFWYTRVLASQSAFKAMAVNKVGDMAFLVGMGLLVKEVGTLNIHLINSMSPLMDLNHSQTISILLLIAVTGKSAQVGLHMWLPDAMEGPTPVSALIHAATMVTAGVFLIIKLSPFFCSCNPSSVIIIFLGGFTCFMAASIGCSQSDLKKVIAYSTCSQLGYMVLVCGYGYYNIGLFHLFNHGIFKALLFLSAGLVIHSLLNEQAILKMGLKGSSKLGRYGLYMGSLAIVGFPFLTGYYSKDLLLELVAVSYWISSPLWLGYIAASFTCFYSVRSLFLSYNANERSSLISNLLSHQSSNFLIVPLFVLGLGSITGGLILSSSILNLTSPLMVSNFTKTLPIVIGLIVITISFFGYPYKAPFLLPNTIRIKKFLVNTWYFNELVNRILITLTHPAFKYTYKLVDNQNLDSIKPSNTSNLMKNLSATSFNFKPHLINILLKTLLWSLIIVTIYM